jgi:hypothetical protein
MNPETWSNQGKGKSAKCKLCSAQRAPDISHLALEPSMYEIRVSR